MFQHLNYVYPKKNCNHPNSANEWVKKNNKYSQTIAQGKEVIIHFLTILFFWWSQRMFIIIFLAKTVYVMSMNSTVEIKWSEMEWQWVVAWSVLFHEQIKFKCELNSRSYANNAHVNFEDTQQKWIRYCCTEAMNLDVYLWNTYHVYTSIAWTMDCSFSLSRSFCLPILLSQSIYRYIQCKEYSMPKIINFIIV